MLSSIDVSTWLGNIPSPVTSEHFIADSLIAMAYLGLSMSVFFLCRREKGFNLKVGLLFGLFILLCGVTHFNSAVAEYSGYCEAYSSPNAHWKVITAAVSVFTLLFIWSLHLRLGLMMGLSATGIRNKKVAAARIRTLKNAINRLEATDKTIDDIEKGNNA